MAHIAQFDPTSYQDSAAELRRQMAVAKVRGWQRLQ